MYSVCMYTCTNAHVYIESCTYFQEYWFNLCHPLLFLCSHSLPLSLFLSLPVYVCIYTRIHACKPIYTYTDMFLRELSGCIVFDNAFETVHRFLKVSLCEYVCVSGYIYIYMCVCVCVCVCVCRLGSV